jgi:carboxymethylenebutenolidase
MSERIRFGSRTGEQIVGALATPAGAAKVPAVIVVHEWWGLNDHIAGIADRWAGEGFLALAVDLYRGVVAKPGDADTARGLMTGLDSGRATADLQGAVDFLATHPRCTGAVVVSGYCMGGALSLRLAAARPGLACAVPFYGVPQNVALEQVGCPVQLHVAQHDEWVTPALADRTAAALRAGGAAVEVHTYDAQHAFCNDTRPEVYDAAAAAAAWAAAVRFAREHASAT